jgi:hypothetical protein
MFDWLDPETRAILAGQPPPKLAPPATAAFTLLFLTKGTDRARIARAVDALSRIGTPNATGLKSVIRQGLTLEEAMGGQFTLACCDCATAFIADDVASTGDREYLLQLSARLAESPEFQPVAIELVSVPDSEAGRRFLWQFMGLAVGLELPLATTVMRKKARLMAHWAEKVGAELQFHDT